jgi:hypothetical protein
MTAPSPQPGPPAAGAPAAAGLGAEVGGLPSALLAVDCPLLVQGVGEDRACSPGARPALRNALPTSFPMCLPTRRSGICPLQSSGQSLDGKPIPGSFVCPVSMEIMVRRGWGAGRPGDEQQRREFEQAHSRCAPPSPAGYLPASLPTSPSPLPCLPLPA